MNKALFLDRDGVINEDNHYVYRIEDFVFLEGVFETLRYFQEIGYLLIIITNQAGIGRGYYTEKEFINLTIWMQKKFEDEGIRITKVYYCPYHPEHGIGSYKLDSNDRKPNPGMILKAKEDLNISLEDSILIGDKQTDILAGMNAGVSTNFLISPNNKNHSNDCIIVQKISDVINYFQN